MDMALGSNSERSRASPTTNVIWTMSAPAAATVKPRAVPSGRRRTATRKQKVAKPNAPEKAAEQDGGLWRALLGEDEVEADAGRGVESGQGRVAEDARDRSSGDGDDPAAGAPRLGEHDGEEGKTDEAEE